MGIMPEDDAWFEKDLASAGCGSENDALRANPTANLSGKSAQTFDAGIVAQCSPCELKG
jgi:hypothetical protein